MNIINGAIEEIALQLLCLDHNIYDNPPKILYHYTNTSGLYGIVRAGSFWATHFKNLGDTEEFNSWKIISEEYDILLENIDLKYREEFKRVNKIIVNGIQYDFFNGFALNTAFVASFTEEGDISSQWKDYDDNGFGYSIGINVNCINDAYIGIGFEKTFMLYKIEYDLDNYKQYITNSFRNFFDWGDKLYISDSYKIKYVGKILFLLLIVSYKRPRFSVEKEWRYLSLGVAPERELTRERNGIIVKYTELNLKSSNNTMVIEKIFMGPNLDSQKVRPDIEKLFKENNYPVPVIIRSSVAYLE